MPGNERRDLGIKCAIDDRKAKAAEYRRRAAQCLQMAERMYAHADRESMKVMAEHWLALHREMEREAGD